MKPYPSYKDSGVEWIGEIPSHWKMSVLKYHISILSGFPFDSKKFSPDSGFPLLRIRDITSGYTETFYDGEFDEKYIVENGDLLIGMDGDFNIRLWNNGKILLNQRCCSIDSDSELIKEYLYYFLPYDLQVINDLTYFTTVKHLSNEDIYNIKNDLPPLSEQKQIVYYLDHKTQQIDELIEKTEKKIELLREKRTSLINHCVTKGLKPDVEMKDSGVEWIREIPNHWEISKVKFEFSFIGGGTPSKENDEYWGGDIPWVSPKDMKSTDISDSEDKITERGLSESSTNLIDKNSLLIVVRSGILQRTIPIGINTIPVTINQDLKSLKPKRGIQTKYFYYFIKGNETNLLKDWSKEGTTVESIEMEFMSNFPIPVPSPSEQQQIVEYLDEHTKKIDSTIEKETQRIELLKEYRQSLISEVVTGKIDVREWKNDTQKLS